jgi:hypothetical protein
MVCHLKDCTALLLPQVNPSLRTSLPLADPGGAKIMLASGTMAIACTPNPNPPPPPMRHLSWQEFDRAVEQMARMGAGWSSLAAVLRGFMVRP